MNIGFIGLGIMGSRMARNLLQAGYTVTVYNRSIEKAEPLKKYGASVANSPKATANSVDVLFSMLADPEAVKAMAYGPNGFLKGLPQQALWVDCSTVNPAFTREIADLATHQQIRFIDAPVAGSKAPAEHGELVFLVGGEETDVNAVRPTLEVMGKAVNHVGANGQGAAMKMVANLLLGNAMAAFSEAMSLGESLGISQEKLLNSLVDGPVTAPFIKGKQNKLEEEDYKPEFPLQWMHKDLQLVAQTAYEVNTPLLATNAVKEVYGQAKQAGKGEADFSALYEYLKGK